MSDSSVSGEARRVYESLKKNKNIKIRTLPAVETPGELVGRNGAYQQRPPGLTNGFGGRPVFAVLWKNRELAARSGRLVEFGEVAEKTNPDLWRSKVAAAKRKFGKWSARASQWAVREYKQAGGGYRGKKSSFNSMAKWTRQKWRTRDGDKAERRDSRGRKVVARYLPDAKWKSLTSGEAAATDAKKRKASRKGKQVVANTEKAKVRELSAVCSRRLSLVEFGLLGHPLKYNRPYIQSDLSIPRGGGNYQAPEAFRFNNQGEKFAPGQEAALAQARKNGVITVGLKKTAKGGWKGVADAVGLTRAADVKRSVIRHEIVHSIQRAKAAAKGESFARNMLNPVKKYIAEVGAYATQNRRRSGIGLGEKLFPTFKAMLNARRSM